MKSEEVYAKWAPTESIWSPWVVPVPFAQLVCVPGEVTDGERAGATGDWWLPERAEKGCAFVVDLPGEMAIEYGLALARRGIRLVPVIDGSPGPSEQVFAFSEASVGPESHGTRKVVVDMDELLRGLCRGARILPELKMSADAPPAFLLDSCRTNGGRTPERELFDNRWKTFPQDFPSARLLKERGIESVVLVQEKAGQPCEDLQHVLLRWQEAGLLIRSQGISESGPPTEIRVDKPSMFRASWYRAMAILGLRRGVFGGFGNWPHSTGG